MSYFSERNFDNVEYSGHETISELLVKRLKVIIDGYTGTIGDQWYVNENDLNFEIETLHPNFTHYSYLYSVGFPHLFDLVEVFLYLSKKTNRSNKMLSDIQRAFARSGSVYFVNERGEVILSLDKDTAKKVSNIESELNSSLQGTLLYLETVGKFLHRTIGCKEAVKDIYISFESFLKNATGKEDFDKSVKYLLNEKILSNPQFRVCNAIYNFRSNSKGTTHDGKDPEPDQVDTLWFIGTVADLMLLIQRRLNLLD